MKPLITAPQRRAALPMCGALLAAALLAPGAQAAGTAQSAGSFPFAFDSGPFGLSLSKPLAPASTSSARTDSYRLERESGSFDGIYRIINGDGTPGDFVSVHTGDGGVSVIAAIYRSADPVGAPSFALTDGGANVAALYKWGSWDLYDGRLSGNTASLSGYSQFGLCKTGVTISFGAGNTIRVAPSGLSDLAPPDAPASACDASLGYWPTLPMQRLWAAAASATVDGIYRITNKDGSDGDYLSVHTNATGGVIATVYRSSSASSKQGFDLSAGGARVATLYRWGSWDLYSGTLSGNRATLTAGYVRYGLCKATGGIAFGQPRTITITPGGASEFAPAGSDALCDGGGDGALPITPAYGGPADVGGGGDGNGGNGNGGDGSGGGSGGSDPGPRSYTLTVTASSGGTVTNGGAMNCTSAGGSACKASYSAGAGATLTATADSAYTFTGWGGDCSGNAPTASLRMDKDHGCTAGFAVNTPPPRQVNLTLNLSGNGSVDDGAAFSCQSTGSNSCTGQYNSGDSVKLTANPATGYTFQGWSDACGSGASTSVTLAIGAADLACGATFVADPAPAITYRLNVAVTGGGSVSDNASAGKISGCTATGGACSASYNAGDSVTLTASPDAGHAVTWSGACAGAGNTASVSMTGGDQDCAAAFAPSGGPLTGPVQPAVLGNQLIDSRTNKPWAPHGASVPSLEYACVQGWAPNANFTQAGAQAMAAWGMDVVRFPLNQDCWLGTDGAPTSGSGSAEDYRARVAQWVGWAHEAGMVVIFDLHWSAPPGYYGIDQLSMTDSQSKTFWQQVAAAYQGDPSVMFELFNEPYEWSGLTWTCWANGGCELPVANQSWGWAPSSADGSATFAVTGMKELVAAVRDAGAKQPVIVNGLNYANDLSGWLANAPDDAQIVAGWHAYKDQGCAAACRDSTIAAVAARVPVLITEFGYEPGEPAYFGQVMDWADARGIGYLPWAWWWNAGTGPYQLLADGNFTPTAGEGAAFKNHLAELAAGKAKAAGLSGAFSPSPPAPLPRGERGVSFPSPLAGEGGAQAPGEGERR